MGDKIVFDQVRPVFRMFDVAKADEFYRGFLGFSVDYDHRVDDHAPLYRQISRDGLIFHLSEHHGDASPGVRVRVMMKGVEAFHEELVGRSYRDMRPALERTPWNTIETEVHDPFGNQICFCEDLPVKTT